MAPLTAILFGILIATQFSSCEPDVQLETPYQTRNVVLIVIDGPRYSETWGDTTHQYIPKMAGKMAPQGVVSSNFYSGAPTWTNSGHTALTTGVYQSIDNGGNELPLFPSFFQYWMSATRAPADAAWIITSKDKLQVLANCRNEQWNGKFNPRTQCGVDGNGVGSGYRNDNETFLEAAQVLKTFHPRLLLISFREPDYTAHSGDWNGYLQGIQDTDELLYRIWNLLENDPFYKNKTTLMVTNDHGRHLDTVADGFVSHGDNCEGCRHINFIALGPDFANGVVTDVPAELIDIPATVAALMNFKMPTGNGRVMNELFDLRHMKKK